MDTAADNNLCPFCSAELADDPRKFCLKCNMSDRHRSVLRLYEALRPMLSSFHCLNLSADQIVQGRDYFTQTTDSVYMGKNSIDIQKIDLPDDNFDFTVCNHVLEHVLDDKTAIQELTRVTRVAVQITVPITKYFYQGKEYGAPDPDIYFHYRHYGADYGARVKEAVPDCEVLSVVLVDPPTNSFDISYLVTKDRAFAENAFVLLRDAGIPCVVM